MTTNATKEDVIKSLREGKPSGSLTIELKDQKCIMSPNAENSNFDKVHLD